MWHKPQLLNAIADLLFVAAAAALLAGVTVWMVRMPTLPIRQVVVSERLQQVKRAEVEQAVAGMLRGNFFSVNLEGVRASLEKLPWVRKAEVRRRWPASLELVLEEHRPVARWGGESRELVNSHGEVFAASLPDNVAAALPLVHGPQGTSAEIIRRYAEFAGMLQQAGLQPVQLVLSPRLAWQLKLADGMVMELGREQGKATIGARLQRFVEIYPAALGQKTPRPAAVDLRYPNGFAVRSRG